MSDCTTKHENLVDAFEDLYFNKTMASRMSEENATPEMQKVLNDMTDDEKQMTLNDVIHILLAHDIQNSDLHPAAVQIHFAETPKDVAVIHPASSTLTSQNIIASYFIADAVCSKAHPLPLHVALESWQTELEAAVVLFKESQLLEMSRPYQALLFGLLVLNRLRFGKTRVVPLGEGEEDLTCEYSHGATNFIIAISGKYKTNKCICISYSLYVQALAFYVGYNEIALCLNELQGHIFNVIQTKDVRIGFDVGYKENKFAAVMLWKTDVNANEIEEKLDFDTLRAFSIQKPGYCDPIPPDKMIFFMLVESARMKHSQVAILRNLLIIDKLFGGNKECRQAIKYKLLENWIVDTFFVQGKKYLSIEHLDLIILHSCLEGKPTTGTLWRRLMMTHSEPDITAGVIILSELAAFLLNEEFVRKVFKHLRKVLQELALVKGFAHFRYFGGTTVSRDIRQQGQQQILQPVLQFLVLKPGESAEVQENAILLASENSAAGLKFIPIKSKMPPLKIVFYVIDPNLPKLKI